MTDYLASVIKSASVVSGKASAAPEIAEVMGRAIAIPQQSVIFYKIEPGRRVEGRACTGRADSLSVVVDRGRDSIRIAGICLQRGRHAARPGGAPTAPRSVMV